MTTREEELTRMFEKYLEPHTCGWKIKKIYIDNGDYFKHFIKDICVKFGTTPPRLVPDEDKLYEMIFHFLKIEWTVANDPNDTDEKINLRIRSLIKNISSQFGSAPCVSVEDIIEEIKNVPLS